MPFTALSMVEQIAGFWAVSWGALFAPTPSEKSSRRTPAPTFALIIVVIPPTQFTILTIVLLMLHTRRQKSVTSCKKIRQGLLSIKNGPCDDLHSAQNGPLGRPYRPFGAHRYTPTAPSGVPSWISSRSLCRLEPSVRSFSLTSPGVHHILNSASQSYRRVPWLVSIAPD